MPEVIETLPVARETPPEGMKLLPEVFRTIPKVFGTIPEVFRAVPEVFGTIPVVFGTVPEDFEAIPEGMGMLPVLLALLPATRETTSKGIGMLPEGMGKLPERRGVVPMVAGTPSKAPVRILISLSLTPHSFARLPYPRSAGRLALTPRPARGVPPSYACFARSALLFARPTPINTNRKRNRAVQQRVAADRSIVFNNSQGVVPVRVRLPGSLNASVRAHERRSVPVIVPCRCYL